MIVWSLKDQREIFFSEPDVVFSKGCGFSEVGEKRKVRRNRDKILEPICKWKDKELVEVPVEVGSIADCCSDSFSFGMGVMVKGDADVVRGWPKTATGES